jgi:hypothetical protein
MSSVEEIERAVEKLPQKDFAKLAAWMDQYQSQATGHFRVRASRSSANWFDVYMACPHSFTIPPRNKKLYHPKA